MEQKSQSKSVDKTLDTSLDGTRSPEGVNASDERFLYKDVHDGLLTDSDEDILCNPTVDEVKRSNQVKHSLNDDNVPTLRVPLSKFSKQ